MRIHSRNSEIAVPDCLSQLRAVRHNGEMVLTDEVRTFSGLMFESEALNNLSTRFSYEAMGYEQMIEGCGLPKRAPIAEYEDGKVGIIRQAIFSRSEDFANVDLEPDLARFENTYRTLFENYGYQVASFMGPKFELRLMPLAYEEENPHFDEDFIIAIKAMGADVEATVCEDETGGFIRSKGPMVVTTPRLKHSWPATKKPRLGLGATLYPHHLP